MNAPNILVLCSDEHSRSALGCYGHPVARTPTLDRLAARGHRFTRAYTPSPICIPARASLATGLHVHETACWSSAQPYYGQHESWMHRLAAAGYHVASVGKLHFRDADGDHGFAEELAPMYLANEGRGWPQGLLRTPMATFPEARELAEEAGPGESDYTEYDRTITREACAWLRRRGAACNGPWAAFVSFVSPHYPLVAPQQFFDLYENIEMPLPPGGGPDIKPEHAVLEQMAGFWDYDVYFDEPTRQLARRCYYGLCSFLDDNIRQVLEALAASGQDRDTLAIYISDHGEMLGSHGFWTKSVMYEESVAIPLIVAGPGVPAGVNATPCSLTDIAATVASAAGLAVDQQSPAWHSHPLQTYFGSEDTSRPILSEYHDGGSPTGFYMLRQNDWKYVHYAGGFAPQLFNLALDPDESNDLAADEKHGETLSALQRELETMLDPEEVNDRAFADQAAVIEALGGREALHAMKPFNHTPVGS